jgi:hypothetical protein
VTFAAGSPLFDPFGVAVAVAVADGTGDFPPGTVGDALAVWAEAGKIAISRTINVAPRKSNVFIRYRSSGSS